MYAKMKQDYNSSIRTKVRTAFFQDATVESTFAVRISALFTSYVDEYMWWATYSDLKSSQSRTHKSTLDTLKSTAKTLNDELTRLRGATENTIQVIADLDGNFNNLYTLLNSFSDNQIKVTGINTLLKTIVP